MIDSRLPIKTIWNYQKLSKQTSVLSSLLISLHLQHQALLVFCHNLQYTVLLFLVWFMITQIVVL